MSRASGGRAEQQEAGEVRGRRWLLSRVLNGSFPLLHTLFPVAAFYKHLFEPHPPGGSFVVEAIYLGQAGP